MIYRVVLDECVRLKCSNRYTDIDEALDVAERLTIKTGHQFVVEEEWEA